MLATAVRHVSPLTVVDVEAWASGERLEFREKETPVKSQLFTRIVSLKRKQ